MVTDKEIRTYLGHGQETRIVRIRRDGIVEYYGSRKMADRSHDYWHYAGKRGEIVDRIEWARR